jgi:cellulose synthase/poly-beta-1,6-N-acetylglucosamine synthase-like glycosyltransferase
MKLQRTREPFQPVPLPADPNEWVVTAVVPAFNEELTIEESLRRIRKVPLTLEIVVVNDGSADRTGEVLDRLGREGLIDRVIHQPKNRGRISSTTPIPRHSPCVSRRVTAASVAPAGR